MANRVIYLVVSLRLFLAGREGSLILLQIILMVELLHNFTLHRFQEQQLKKILPLFEEHGNIIEVVLPRDKRTDQQQGFCFVKYVTFEEAGRAIRALNNHYIFPGEQAPIKVRYADGERKRPGAPPEKLYVGCLTNQTSKREIEEVVDVPWVR